MIFPGAFLFNLKKQRAVPPFQVSAGLWKAAKYHAEDIGKYSLASHEGSKGKKMIERVQRFGQWQRSLAENICFDDDDPKEIVFNMLVGKFQN